MSHARAKRDVTRLYDILCQANHPIKKTIIIIIIIILIII